MAIEQTITNMEVRGEVMYTGATNYTGKFINRITGLNGIRYVPSEAYVMGVDIPLNVPGQNTISDQQSLTPGVPTPPTKSQKPNVTQIQKKDIGVSNKRAASKQFQGLNVPGNEPTITPYDRDLAVAMMELRGDMEFTAIQGVYVPQATDNTNVKSGGLLDTTIGITTNRVSAAAGALSYELIKALVKLCTNSGAPMQLPALVFKPTYAFLINEIFALPPLSAEAGGSNIQIVSLAGLGNVELIGTNAAPNGKVVLADLMYCKPVIMPHETGEDVLHHQFENGASAKQGFIETFFGMDFGLEKYHGAIVDLATP